MHPLPSFQSQLAAVHISHAAVAGAPRGAGSCRVCTFFLLRGFILHSPVGSKTPQEGRTHAGKQSEMDSEERKTEVGGNRVAPRRFYAVSTVKTPGMVSRNLSGRVGIAKSFSCGGIWRNSGSGSFHLKKLKGLSCPPACTTATLLLPLVTGEVAPRR